MHARCLIASVVLLLAVSVPAWSQTLDSVERDPATWLATHLGGAACVVFDAGPSPQRLEHVTENTEVRFAGCRMVLEQSSTFGTRQEVRTFTVPLGALDANAVAASEGFPLPEGWTSKGDVPTHTVRLIVAAGQPLIAESVDTFDGTPAGHLEVRTLEILVRHQENAVQIVRAFTLAIAACGSGVGP